MTDCVFCKIVSGEFNSTKVYEDEEMLAFKDINPVAPTHILLVPKKHIVSLAEASASDAPLLGRMMNVAAKIAKDAGLRDGFRLIVNTGRIGGQEVPHLHYHIIGGPEPIGRMVPQQ